MGQGLFIHEVSRSHTTTHPSVELLWTRDQPVAETSTRQHTTFTTNIYVPDAIRTHNPSRRAAADLRLRPRGHWDRQVQCKSYSITDLHSPLGFQEVEAPRFQDNRHMAVVRLSALRTGRLYLPGNISGTHFCYRGCVNPRTTVRPQVQCSSGK